MTVRFTKKKRYVRLAENRIKEIQELVYSWSYGTKTFMRSRINQYKPPNFIFAFVKKSLFFLSGIFESSHRFKTLKDPDILTNWQKRFEISGESAPKASWNKILSQELSNKDYLYLITLLNEELKNIHIPFELQSFFTKIYRAHIRKEYLTDHSIPQAPLILVTGTSGSGKTATITEAIEQLIFDNKAQLKIDLEQKKENLLKEQPFWKSLNDIDPALAREIEQGKRLFLYKFLSKVPVIRSIFKKKISRNLMGFEEQSILLDYSIITPNDYQTAYSGEPGNYLKKAFGSPNRPAIRHIEEAHSAFGKADEAGEVSGRQQRTLIDSANIIIDEIISGRRDCLLIATTDKPELFEQTIYRRFVEKGIIIDISKYWQNANNLKEIIRLELSRNDVRVTDEQLNGNTISTTQLDVAVNYVVEIFREKSLRIIPAYARKLIQSIIEIKDCFQPEFLNDSVLVRRAFELVAQNSYGDLFKKVVDKMDRSVHWEDYVGNIKNKLSEMANNCLNYKVNDEKGVVLEGPPGSGKTFLVRCWLSENEYVHDISASLNDLYNPSNPYDGTAQNLENLYDIAKMIAPSIVFFDEGDSLAPKRSAGGGSPSDKLTNKFLNLIDGEVPLNKVFTILTTNRVDIMDPALVRSKRLKILEVSGHLMQKDIDDMVGKLIKKIQLAPDLTVQKIINSAQGISNTPADYTAFIEKALSLRKTEYIVLKKIQTLITQKQSIRENFIKLNYKTLQGILSTLDAPYSLRINAGKDLKGLIDNFDRIVELVNNIDVIDDYALTNNHITGAREEISENPLNKGKIQLDTFLEAELSQEPQIGFIIGAGANDVSGVLLPIATSLIYNFSPQKIMVTGAVSSSTSATAQMELAVKMTRQSADEALTLVKNYLQNLISQVSITRLLGEFLDKYTIHHQLLSASYSVGGPSAGYAIAINTISAILRIPIYNDFGITGAPWTKGVTSHEVGGSVIIGGHKKKAEKVLMHLRRMYLPHQNYLDFSEDFLESYWTRGKDILEVSSFGDLLPEVVWIDHEYEKTLNNLVKQRIALKYNAYHGNDQNGNSLNAINILKQQLRHKFEVIIIERLLAIKSFLNDKDHDHFLTHLEIFNHYRNN